MLQNEPANEKCTVIPNDLFAALRYLSTERLLINFVRTLHFPPVVQHERSGSSIKLNIGKLLYLKNNETNAHDFIDQLKTIKIHITEFFLFFNSISVIDGFRPPRCALFVAQLFNLINSIE